MSRKRIPKRINPKNSSYARKTIHRHGREVVKYIKRDDWEEMIRLCLNERDRFNPHSAAYYRWYRNYIILLLGVNTGMRITTLLESIPRDFAGGEVTLTEHKTGKRMQYRMQEDVYQILKEYIEFYGFKNNDYMFLRKMGSQNDIMTREAAWHMIKGLAKKANIEYIIACHSLRKSFGRWMYDETHDLLLVQNLLMHNSAEETMRYICLEESEVEKVRESIGYLSKYY